MLDQVVNGYSRVPVIAARRGPPGLRRCCDSYVCPVCTQVVELTDYCQVLWHQRPGHQPMDVGD
ncbi:MULTISPECIES: hypothetical protein [unclassified Mesorhizobium]|uniref:hypothetical protein n=1 Tax=unclassified Mesorhizobium TaxID=325217 RepID=UPI001126CAE0|nr:MULTISPECIES: hypothetical protein [unclassified Mesorhizobium]TPI19811.1 hypothetical protein FJW10_13785 [Mesorhizobium sp. B4-1-1]TPL49861.1 hypothetical protein FJ957_12445 [Mesorhizobium sp. B2-4-6]